MPNNINLDIFFKALLLTPFCLAFIYFIIIFASNANVKRVNQWTIKVDNWGAKVPQIIEFFYKYAGKLEWFIISVTILLFLLFVDVLSLLILRHGIISDNIALYSLGGAVFFGLCFAYKNMIFYAGNHIKYRKWDDVQINKKKNFFLSLLFILFIFPMPVLTVFGSLEQASTAIGQDNPFCVVWESIKVIPFFEAIFYDMRCL